MKEKEHRVFPFTEWEEIDQMNLKQVMSHERTAAQTLKECEALITFLNDYRIKLAARYNELAAMQSNTRVTLKREKRWKGEVNYFIIKHKTFEDGTTEFIDSKRYPGKERHKAIADFKKIKKENPHFEFVEDIQKGRWE